MILEVVEAVRGSGVGPLFELVGSIHNWTLGLVIAVDLRNNRRQLYIAISRPR